MSTAALLEVEGLEKRFTVAPPGENWGCGAGAAWGCIAPAIWFAMLTPIAI